MSTCPLLFIVHTRWVSTSEQRCIRDVNNPQSKVRRQYHNYDCDCIACQTLRAPQHNQWKELIEEIAVMAMDGVCHCGVLWRHHDLVGTGPKHKQDHADSAWLLRYISLLYFIHPFGSNGLFQVSIYANSNNIIMENLWWWATHTHTQSHMVGYVHVQWHSTVRYAGAVMTGRVCASRGQILFLLRYGGKLLFGICVLICVGHYVNNRTDL